MKKDRYRIAIVKYTAHTSLNRIEAGLKNGLDALGPRHGVLLDHRGLVCDGQADPRRMAQIGRELAGQGVDLVLSIATPTTAALKPILAQAGIPLVFRAVSDPVGAGVIDGFDRPGSGITGTSDALDGALLARMLLAAQPGVERVGLLYDREQVSSRSPIAEARAYLTGRGIQCLEATPGSPDQVPDAGRALLEQGAQAILTPTDNTIMSAELALSPLLTAGGAAHYTGSNAFTINGAFFGLGSSYREGDRQSMELVEQILFGGKAPGDIPVIKGGHDLATVNCQACQALGFNEAALEATFAALGARTVFLDSQEEFDEDSY